MSIAKTKVVKKFVLSNLPMFADVEGIKMAGGSLDVSTTISMMLHSKSMP